MRVLFITPYFPPELGAAQTRIYELALRLQNKGHQVAVLTTFPNYPSGALYVDSKGKLWIGALGLYSYYKGGGSASGKT